MGRSNGHFIHADLERDSAFFFLFLGWYFVILSSPSLKAFVHLLLMKGK